MPSGPEAPWHATAYPAAAALPRAAAALFGAHLFDSAGWFTACEEAALPAGQAPAYVVISQGARPVALIPMLRGRRGCGSFTTPYSSAWRPLLAEGADSARAGAAWGAWCRRQAWRAGTLRLDALDLAAPGWAGLLAGLGRSGWAALPFAHFGNWRGAAPRGWAEYLAARPGETRETLRRRGRKLMAAGAEFTLIRGAAGLDAGIAAYQSVYARSWKEPEPHPEFIPVLMRRLAPGGTLRLGILAQGGAVLAAQFWVCEPPWAGVLKLAHDEAHRAASPGTVLTGMMIEKLLAEGVTELDFGRGDDPYKQSWAPLRAQREGLILALRWHPLGLAEIGRAALRRRVSRP